MSDSRRGRRRSIISIVPWDGRLLYCVIRHKHSPKSKKKQITVTDHIPLVADAPNSSPAAPSPPPFLPSPPSPPSYSHTWAYYYNH